MFELLAFAVGINQFGLPLVGLIAVIMSRLNLRRGAEVADRCLLAILSLMVVMTFHGLLSEGPQWMLHGITLGIMIIGAVWEIPRKLEEPVSDEA